MEYIKEFSKDKTTVTITFTDDNFFWDPESHVKTKKREFEVIKREEIYEKINDGKPINLNSKYIKGFSLSEYRKIYNINEYDKVVLNNFQVENSFFEANKSSVIDFLFADFKGIYISFQYTIFGDGYVDFRYANFGKGEVNFENSRFGDGEVNFTEAEFKSENVHFKYTKFGKANVYFSKTKFGDANVYFLNTIFGEGNVHFNDAQFGKGKIYFSFANFGDGNVKFHYANFEKGDVDFSHSKFGNGTVDFSNARYGEKGVTFNYTNFGDGNFIFRINTSGKADITFINAKFGKSDIDLGFSKFEDIKFIFDGITHENGKFYLYKSRFSEISFKNSEISGKWDMRLEKADLIDFSNAIINDIIDFGIFKGTNKKTAPKIRELRVINTKLLGKIYMDYAAIGLENAVNSQDSSHREKRDQFRLFKENFRSLGQYDDEDKAYVQFMYHKIRAEAEIEEKDRFWKRVIKKSVFGFKWLVFEKMGKYGTSPRNVAISMAIAVVFFSLLYCLPPFHTSNFSPIFHSVITFLTIGYGTDFINLNFWGKLLSGMEGFMGLFLMSYFTISFVRKVLR